MLDRSSYKEGRGLKEFEYRKHWLEIQTEYEHLGLGCMTGISQRGCEEIANGPSFSMSSVLNAK